MPASNINAVTPSKPLPICSQLNCASIVTTMANAATAPANINKDLVTDSILQNFLVIALNAATAPIIKPTTTVMPTSPFARFSHDNVERSHTAPASNATAPANFIMASAIRFKLLACCLCLNAAIVPLIFLINFLTVPVIDIKFPSAWITLPAKIPISAVIATMAKL